jgi:hypothetical protein
MSGVVVENAKAFGILDALRGMRNPLNSWDKNDSRCKCDPSDGHVIELELGPNDQKLCRALTLGGAPHRKFLRQIFVTMDITAPMYWWAEMDTYKICSTRNSCSVQHKGASREFAEDDFTFEELDTSTIGTLDYAELLRDKRTMLEIVNKWRNKYVDGGKTNYSLFRVMRQFLPSAYNYKTTWSGNYEVLMNIYKWRKNHKLKEWHEFCAEVEKLPGMEFFLSLEKIEST